MRDAEKIVDVCLLTVGTVTGLANIEHILGIIILVIQLAWLLTKFIVKVFNTLKNNESLDILDDDVGSVINSLKNVQSTLNFMEESDKNEHNSTEQK